MGTVYRLEEKKLVATVDSFQRKFFQGDQAFHAKNGKDGKIPGISRGFHCALPSGYFFLL
jgi:hypothetical protein